MPATLNPRQAANSHRDGNYCDPAEVEIASRDDEEFRQFAARLRARDDAAAQEFFDRYSARLIMLARARMSPRLATKSDPEDVVQSVMRTFFRRLNAEAVELRDWVSLWGLLSLLTIRKCAMWGRLYSTASRDVAREVSLTSKDSDQRDILGREPTPAEVSALVDMIEQLLATSSATDKVIVEGLLNGQSISELAREINRTERTVYRASERIRHNLFKLMLENDPS